MKAPEFDGKNKTWINSQPLSWDDLKGKVVLIDFWTYSCVNCLRTLPFLKEWHEKYKDKGLIIIGVHTPEFVFEKNENNLRTFVEKNEIRYPVVVDNDFEIWQAYGNKYWPSKYLVDKNGQIQYHHFGEGAYMQTEKAIQTLLFELSPLNTFREISRITASSERGKVCFPATPELYAGYARGGPVNKAEFGTPIMFTVPPEIKTEGYYLNGLWAVYPDRLKHARTTESPDEDFLVLSFSSFEVNAVLAPSDKNFQATVTLNNEPIPLNLKGKDIFYDNSGKSLVNVNQPRMYNLITSKKYFSGLLGISSQSSDFELYAFTFSSCSEEAAA